MALSLVPRGFYRSRREDFIAQPHKLTIKGEGTLVATGDVELEEHGPGVTTAHVHAGIGGANNACGTIVIESGTIRATGAQSLFAPSDSSSDTIGAAGIGGHGHYGKGGSISITGGTVSATGGERAAGIGGGNGGTSIAAQTLEPGGKAHRPSTPALSDNTFKGWYSDSALISSYNFDTPVLEDLVLYAKWEKDPVKVVITFRAQGGTGTMKPQTIVQDKPATLVPNAYKRSGYLFSGWNTKPNGSGTSYADKASITITSDTTLYAQWTEALTVKFVEGKGTPTIVARTLTKLARTLHTADEKTQPVRIELRSKALAADDVPADDRKIAEALAKKQGAKAGVWFDLSLFKKVGDMPETGDILPFVTMLSAAAVGAAVTTWDLRRHAAQEEL